MFPLKSLIAAFVLVFATPLTLSSIASAQGTKIIVIDQSKIVNDSKAGKDMRTKLTNIETAMKGELQPTATQLSAEETAINTKTQNMTPEAMRADANLKTEVESYMRKANDFNRKRQIVAQELALTERKAWGDFLTALRPVLQEVVTENNAQILLDRTQVTYVDPAVDLTASVIAKLDAKTPTINVVRQRVPTQQAQQ